MFKRILSGLLCIAMLLSVAAPALAAEIELIEETLIVDQTRPESTIRNTTTQVFDIGDDFTLPSDALFPTDPDDGPIIDDPWADPTEPEDPGVRILLIQDSDPWWCGSNNRLLEKLLNDGWIDDYTITGISDAVGMDFSEYTLVMIPGDQTDSYYSTYASGLASKIDAYVQAGGVLYFSACDTGMANNPGVSGYINMYFSALPGGVQLNITDAWGCSIADASHPIITGEYTGSAAVTSIYAMDYSFYGTFVESSLPAGTRIIARTDNRAAAPALVDYPYGEGWVVASGLDWEYCYGYDAWTDAYDDVFVYALKQSPSGGKDPSATEPPTEPADTTPVGNLRTEYVGCHTVKLAWDPATNGDVVGYRIYCDGDLVGEVGACTFTDFAGVAGRDYEYRVIGYTAAGLELEPAILTVPTRPAPMVTSIYTDNGAVAFGPSTILYAKVETDLDLSEAFATFYLDGMYPIGDVECELTADGAIYKVCWELTDVTAGIHDVVFQLTNVDSEACFLTEQITVVLDTPDTVVGLMAQSDVNSIYLTWSIAAEYDVDTYRVYRRDVGQSDWTLLSELSGDRSATSYEDKTATPDVTYEYVVTAVSPHGMESEYCQPVSCALTSDKEAPVINSLTPARGTVLNQIVTVTATASDNDRVAKMELYYRRSADGEAVCFASAEGESISAKLDTTIISDGSIEIYAIAVDASGNVSNGIPVYTCKIDNTGPSAVSGLASSATSTVITLSWSYLQDDDFDHFVVERKNADGSFTQVATSNKTLGANLTGLKPATEYTYRVFVVDRVGNVSEYSEEFTASTADDTTAPVVSAISPSAGYRNRDFTISFTLKDDAGVAGATVQISYDRLNWTTVEEVTFDVPGRTRVLDYDVYVGNYGADGSIYFRAIPVDEAGNQGDSNTATAPFVEYVLDRCAPNVPQGVAASPSGNGNYLVWENDPAGEAVAYRILRAESEDGVYQLIGTVQAISYYDRSAQSDIVYWYKIQSVDQVGNVSVGCEAVSCVWSVTSDTQAPEILSIAPGDGNMMGGNNKTISVLAQDDRTLSRIVVTCQQLNGKGDILDSWTVTLTGNETYYLRASFNPDLSGFTTGDLLQVTAVPYDANDNAGNPAISTYTVDKTAPGVKDLKASLSENTVLLTWKAGTDSEDLNGYYIYRSNGAGWTKVGTRAARQDGSYSFTDPLSASGAYTYKVVSIDLLGNQAEFLSNAVSYTMPAAERVIADFVTDRQQQQGVEYLFDASGSSTSVGAIVSYHYDFGDGTAANTAQAVHSYEQTGTYTVVLTVMNDMGVEASATMTVVVKERASLGNVTVTVLNDSGVPVSNTPVYFDMDSDNAVIKYTNALGMVSFTATADTYTIGAYMDGYLPVTKQVILSGGATRPVELIMVEQPIVTGEFEVKQMTLAEIIAAGIDTTSPANQHCVSVTAQVSYGEKKVDLNFVRNESGNVVQGTNTATIDDRQFTAIVIPDMGFHSSGDGNGSSDDGGGGGAHLPPKSDIVVILETPVTASFLKEFFHVKLHVLNQATEEFILVDNSIELSIPDGMTLMSESQNTKYEWKDSICGQQEWTLSWILRGDREGDYVISADYAGTLSGFDAEVKATFESPSIHVYGTSAVNLILNFNQSVRYQACYLDVGLKNMTAGDLNLPSVTLGNAIISSVDALKNGVSDEEAEDISIAPVPIRTWVENEYGYQELLSDTPLSISGGETLYHRYAIYGVSEDDKVLWLNNLVLEELNNIGMGQVQVYVNEFDLYPDDVANAEAIMEAGNTVAKDALGYLTDPTNFIYYRTGDDDKNNIFHNMAAVGKDALDVVLTFKFDCFTNNTNKKFFRGIVAELMSDEVVEDYVESKLSTTYANAVEKILKRLGANLKVMDTNDWATSENGVVDLDATIQAILRDEGTMSMLSATLQKEGVSTGFAERVGRLFEAAFSNVAFEVVVKEFDLPEYKLILNDQIKLELGDIGEFFEIGADLAQGWANAVDAANMLMTLQFAYDETSYFLNTVIDQMTDVGKSGHWMCDEAKAMLQELDQESQEVTDTFVRVFAQEVLELGSEKLTEEGMKKACEAGLKKLAANEKFGGLINVGELGIVYKVLKLVYKVVDYTLNLSDYYERKDQIMAMMTMNALFMSEYQEATSAEGQVRALKYIIKTHLSGERVYAEYVNADKHRQELFEQGYGASVNVYLRDVNRRILSARDRLYNTAVTQQQVPAAPEELTFDYLHGYTNQRFDSAYEYSLNGGETWTTCGNAAGEADHIRVSGKTVSQALYVRVKATATNRSGQEAVLLLRYQPRLSYATGAGRTDDICAVWGLIPNAHYEVLVVSKSEMDEPDWSQAMPASADKDGYVMIRGIGDGDYLLYRHPSNCADFASEAHSILLSRDLEVEIQVNVKGSGSVTCNGMEFSSGVVTFGKLLTLSAGYDTVSTEFKGWYLGDVLYSDKLVLEIEATRNMELTARFDPLAQYAVTVTAGEGGAVTGGGIFYKGQKTVARAYAEKGYTFSHWEDASGKIVGVSSTRDLTVMEDLTLKAVFVELPKARIFASLSVQNVENMMQPGVDVALLGNTYHASVEQPFREVSGMVTQGEYVTLTAKGTADAAFVCWQTDKGVTVSTDPVLTICALEYNSYVAVFRVSGQTVTFADKFKATLSSIQYPASVQAELIAVPSATPADGYEFVGWRIGNSGHIYTEGETLALQKAIAKLVASGTEVIVNAIHEKLPEQYLVTVVNGSGSGTYDASYPLAINADPASDGQVFAGWYEDGVLLSTNETYYFFVTADRHIEARYTEDQTDRVGATNLESVTSNTETGKISFVSMCSVPEDCTIQRAGIIATSDATVANSGNFTASTAAYVRYASTAYHNYKYTWTKSKVTADQVWYVRAYLVYTDANGNVHTVYGDVIAATLAEGRIN